MGSAHFFSLMAPLALAAIDPVSVFFGLYFLAKHPGPRGRRTVMTFCLMLIIGIPLWGMVLLAFFGEDVENIPWDRVLETLRSAATAVVTVEALLGLALLTFAWFRLHRARTRVLVAGSVDDPELRVQKERSALGLYALGVGIILFVTTNVPFLAYVALAAHEPVGMQFVGLLGWGSISQILTLSLLLALIFRKERGLARVLTAMRRRLAPIWAVVFPVLCMVLGVALVLDALAYLLLGLNLVEWLV